MKKNISKISLSLLVAATVSFGAALGFAAAVWRFSRPQPDKPADPVQDLLQPPYVMSLNDEALSPEEFDRQYGLRGGEQLPVPDGFDVAVYVDCSGGREVLSRASSQLALGGVGYTSLYDLEQAMAFMFPRPMEAIYPHQSVIPVCRLILDKVEQQTLVLHPHARFVLPRDLDPDVAQRARDLLAPLEINVVVHGNELQNEPPVLEDLGYRPGLLLDEPYDDTPYPDFPEPRF